MNKQLIENAAYYNKILSLSIKKKEEKEQYTYT